MVIEAFYTPENHFVQILTEAINTLTTLASGVEGGFQNYLGADTARTFCPVEWPFISMKNRPVCGCPRETSMSPIPCR